MELHRLTDEGQMNEFKVYPTIEDLERTLGRAPTSADIKDAVGGADGIRGLLRASRDSFPDVHDLLCELDDPRVVGDDACVRGEDGAMIPCDIPCVMGDFRREAVNRVALLKAYRRAAWSEWDHDTRYAHAWKLADANWPEFPDRGYPHASLNDMVREVTGEQIRREALANGVEMSSADVDKAVTEFIATWEGKRADEYETHRAAHEARVAADEARQRRDRAMMNVCVVMCMVGGWFGVAGLAGIWVANGVIMAQAIIVYVWARRIRSGEAL